MTPDGDSTSRRGESAYRGERANVLCSRHDAYEMGICPSLAQHGFAMPCATRPPLVAGACPLQTPHAAAAAHGAIPSRLAHLPPCENYSLTATAAMGVFRRYGSLVLTWRLKPARWCSVEVAGHYIHITKEYAYCLVGFITA